MERVRNLSEFFFLEACYGVLAQAFLEGASLNMNDMLFACRAHRITTDVCPFNLFLRLRTFESSYLEVVCADLRRSKWIIICSLQITL